jgi:hypothetical protein
LIEDYTLGADRMPLLGEIGIYLPKKGFTAAQLMRMDLPEPDCIVDGIITQGVNIFAGRPKTGKSWAALDTALGVATGAKALGGLPVKQGGVLYLALEDNKRRLKSRMAKLLAGAPSPSNLVLVPEWPRLDQGGLEAIEQWIKGTKNPRLVIIDTLAKVRSRLSRGRDAYSDDYGDIGEIKSLADENEVGIWLNHHVRKLRADDIVDEVSGTLGISGAADTILVLNRERGKHDACLHVTGRDIDEREFPLSWDNDSCRWSIMDEPIQELRMTEERQKILDALRSAGAPLEPKAIAERLGDKDSGKVRRLAHSMVKDDQLKKTGKGYLPVDPSNNGNAVTFAFPSGGRPP